MSQAFALVFVLAVAVQQPPPAAPPVTPPASPLPGGATSLQETYGDWTVMCGQRDGKKICAMSQQLLDKDSRQRVVVMELSTVAADKASGTLLLPFGLAVAKDVRLQFDAARVAATTQIRTCIQAGCLVDLTFDAKMVGDLRRENALSINATADGGQPISFSISLKGFPGALDRTVTLSR